MTKVAQVNSPLPNLGVIAQMPKQFHVLRYFNTFMDDIILLEDAIEKNSEIKVSTFLSPYEKEKREVFQKQLLPHVQHLRLDATH